MSVQLNFSTQNVSLDAVGVVFPSNWYKFVATDSKVVAVQGGTGSSMLVYELTCIEGPLKDNKFYLRLNLFHATSEVAVRIAKSELARLCMVAGLPQGMTMSAELHGRPFWGEIKSGMQEGKKNADGSPGKQIMSQELIDLKDLQGRSPKDIAAAMGLAPQQGAGGPPMGATPPQNYGAPPAAGPPAMGAPPAAPVLAAPQQEWVVEPAAAPAAQTYQPAAAPGPGPGQQWGGATAAPPAAGPPQNYGAPPAAGPQAYAPPPNSGAPPAAGPGAWGPPAR